MMPQPEHSETPFRLYGLDEQGEPKCLAECDEFSIGDALLDLRRRRLTVAGIMHRPFDGYKGDWLINPWDTPETAAAFGRLRGATSESTEGGEHGTDE
jgi:hypothetical protein